MYKIFGADGREYGPVSAEVLKQWIAQGRANGETRVLPEGGAEWKLLREVPELAVALHSVPPPAFSMTPVYTGSALPPDVEMRDYRIDIGDCLNRAWALVTGPQMWLVIGGVAVWLLIQMAIQGLAQIPLLGILIVLANFVITAPLMGGVLYYVLRCLRGEPAKIDDLFAGFKYRFGNLFLCHLIISLLAGVAAIPGAVMLIGGIVIADAGHHSDAAMIGGVCLGAGGAIVLLIPLIYLGVSFAFAITLVIDKNLDFWPAIQISRRVVGRHFFVVLLVVLLSTLLQVAGVCLCCIGTFFTTPLALAFQLSAYERMFTEPSPTSPQLTGHV